MTIRDDHLVVLDLEGLLAPRMTQAGAESVRGALQHHRDSPIAIWILPPVWAFGPFGSRPADLSPLSQGGKAPSTGKLLTMALDETGRPALVSRYQEQVLASRQPYADGRYQGPCEYADGLVDGYREMNRWIIEGGASLPWDHKLADLRVRFVPRNTAFYDGLLQQSLLPSCLQSGIDRDLCLQQLFRACHDFEDGSPQVIQAEIDALSRLDIPYFRFIPGQDALLLENESRVPRYFDGSALDLLRQRLAGFDDSTLQEHVDILLSGLETSRQSTRRRDWPPDDRSAPGLRSGHGDWMESAKSIGDDIIGRAFQEKDGLVSYFGINYLPTYDVCELGVLRTDLFSGLGGLAVVLLLSSNPGCRD